MSEYIRDLLKSGMKKAPLVEKYFQEYYDPLYGDEIVSAFHKEYQQCKELHMDADSIFSELQKYAGGRVRKSPRYEAAVLAVLAYLFEQCEIFERPTDEARL